MYITCLYTVHPPVFSTRTCAPVQQLPKHTEDCTVVEDEIPDDYLHEVADNIGKDWSRLGVRLGMQFGTLEKIKHDSRSNIRQQAYLMLVHWKNTHKSLPTIVELQDKVDELRLCNIGLNNVRS